MTAEREEFGFTPDWREQIPFWLILPKTLLLVGVPVWVLVVMVANGIYSIDLAFVLGVIALAGGRHVAIGADRAVKRRRRLHGEGIVADSAGLRVLPPYGEWRKFPWKEVRELTITTAGGLFGDGLLTVEAGGAPCAIPPYVNTRRELLRLIRFRANLTREKKGWWATTWRRG